MIDDVSYDDAVLQSTAVLACLLSEEIGKYKGCLKAEERLEW